METEETLETPEAEDYSEELFADWLDDTETDAEEENAAEDTDVIENDENEADETEEVDVKVENEEESEENDEESESNNENQELNDEVLKFIRENAKYNHENVDVKSRDEVLEKFQKGLNYDKLLESKEKLENSDILKYFNEKAEENNMNTEEYLKAIRDYETEQEETKYKKTYEEMIAKGVPEEMAKEISETAKLRKELSIRTKELDKQEIAKNEKAKADADRQAFIDAFPDVKVDEIPKDVLAKSKDVGLKNAYTEYSLEQAKQEIAVLRQNKENASKAPVKGVTEHGGVKAEAKDPFWDGFNGA